MPPSNRWSLTLPLHLHLHLTLTLTLNLNLIRSLALTPPPIQGESDTFRVYFGGSDAVVGSAVVRFQASPCP